MGVGEAAGVVEEIWSMKFDTLVGDGSVVSVGV